MSFRDNYLLKTSANDYDEIGQIRPEGTVHNRYSFIGEYASVDIKQRSVKLQIIQWFPNH